MRKPVIAIDGFSSTGKSSISKVIAEKLGLIHMDTGALYRGITYFALQCCKNEKANIDLQKLISNLNKINLEFREENGMLVLFLNNTDISSEIRTPEISEHVSQIATLPEVREFLLHTQRSIAEKGGVIMDGRDIGSIVLPNADYKFFLTASIDERTKRRHLELLSLGIKTDAVSVKENLTLRDKTDSERTVAPLIQAKDAILIDNSELTKKETIQLILSHIKTFNNI